MLAVLLDKPYKARQSAAALKHEQLPDVPCMLVYIARDCLREFAHVRVYSMTCFYIDTREINTMPNLHRCMICVFRSIMLTMI